MWYKLESEFLRRLFHGLPRVVASGIIKDKKMITKKAYPQAKWKLWWPEEDIISKTFYVFMLVCNGPLVTSSSQLVVIEGLSLIRPDSSYRSMEILTMFVNRIREMVSFELGRGIEKAVVRLVTSMGQRKQKSPNEESNLTLSKLLILAVCRTRVIWNSK